MGWFKKIIIKKKTKVETPRKHRADGSKASRRLWDPTVPLEDAAATRIQTAFRRYKARKALRCLKGMKRLQNVTKVNSTEKQASNTLNYIQSWNRIQTQISSRRLSMVIEGRIKQKKLENQLKLEAKLHDIEVEWCGGSETMEEIVARIRQREEAAVKRERTLAYAYSHQWRPNATQNLGRFAYEIRQERWGWSWVDRWIAVRPWEVRLRLPPSKQNTKTQRKLLPNGNINNNNNNGNGTRKQETAVKKAPHTPANVKSTDKLAGKLPPLHQEKNSSAAANP